MDRAAARARLQNMVAATSRPVLTTEPDGDLDTLLDLYAIRDTAGLAPSDGGWVGTWDLNAAAAEGWRWKAGKVAGDYNFSADDASYSKADVLANCLEMEARYLAKVTGSSIIQGGQSTTYDASELIP